MKIVLKDESDKYTHLVTRSPRHVALREKIRALFNSNLDSSDLELNVSHSTKFHILMSCLKHVDHEIKAQLKAEYFNVVRILIVIDDLTVSFNDSYETSLARAFLNESIRMLLTQYDLKHDMNRDLYTSIDYSRLDYYPAYPVHGAKKQKIQRNEICLAALEMGAYLDNRYPDNYEYLNFGSYGTNSLNSLDVFKWIQA